MSEAKQMPSGHSNGSWCGPRAVLASIDAQILADSAGPERQSIQSIGYDDCAWDCRSMTPTEVLPLLVRAHADGQTCCSLACRCDAIDVRDGVDQVHALLESGSDLGVRSLCLTLAPVVAVTAKDETVHGFRRYQDQINFVGGLLRETRLAFGRAGVTLAIEAPGIRGLLSPVELRELLDGAFAPSVGVCLDVSAVGSIGSAVDWSQTLRQYVSVVRLSSDANDTNSVLTALAQQRFDGAIVCPEPAWIPKCRAALVHEAM